MTRGTKPPRYGLSAGIERARGKTTLTEIRCLKQLFRRVLGRLAADLIQADGSAACQYAQH